MTVFGRKKRENVQANASNEMVCPSCGARNASDAVFCSKCGNVVEQEETLEIAENSSTKKNSKTAKKGAIALATKTNDLTGIKYMFEGGLALDTQDRWSRTLEFGDISYDQELKETRNDIYDKMCQFHAMFPPSSTYQINLLNLPEVRDSQTRAAQLLPIEGPNIVCAQAFNNLIRRKQTEGRTEIRRVNLLTMSTEASDAESAESTLSVIRGNASALLARMEVTSKLLDGEERLRLAHDLLRGPREPFFFSYEKLRHGGRARDYVAPEYAYYPPESLPLRAQLALPNFRVRTLRIANFGSELSDAALRRLRSLPIPMNISLQFSPKPKGEILRKVNGNLQSVEGEIGVMQGKLTNQGMDYAMIPAALRDRRDDALALREHLIEDDQQVTWFQGLITIYADNDEQMKAFEQMLMDEAQIWSISLVRVPLFQEEALISTQPLANSRLPKLMRSLTTSEAAVMMPWANEIIAHDPRKSYCFVQHARSLAPLFIDPDELKSPHTMIFGVTGGGKGMLINTFITHMLLSYPRTEHDEDSEMAVSPVPTAPQILIFDRHAEYTPLAKEFNAPVYKFRPGGTHRLNPFDVQAESGPLTAEDVSKNADFFMALAEDVLEGELSTWQRSIVDRCLAVVFEPHLGKETRPTLTDFREALRAQPEPEAKEIALAFEIYTDGLMSAFNGQTNVHDARHLTIYDCSELGSTLNTLAIISTLQHVRNVAMRNFLLGIPTYAVIEEVQVLFETPAAMRMLDSFYGEMRKFNAHLICVTQHPERVLDHPVARQMFENTGLIVLLPMQEYNANYIANLFRLSPTQREVIDMRSDPGKGLVIADGRKIPFNARIDPRRDKYLYELWNTDPNREFRALARQAQEQAEGIELKKNEEVQGGENCVAVTKCSDTVEEAAA